MGTFIIRRLVQAVLTVFGVMLLTFVLFRLVAGDVTAQFVNVKLGKEARVAWLHRHHLDLPMVLNVQRHITLRDTTDGNSTFSVDDVGPAKVTSALLLQAVFEDTENAEPTPGSQGRPVAFIQSAGVQLMSPDTKLREVASDDPWLPRRATQTQSSAEEEPPGEQGSKATDPNSSSAGSGQDESPDPNSPSGSEDAATSADPNRPTESKQPEPDPNASPWADPNAPAETGTDESDHDAQPVAPAIRIHFADGSSMVADLTPLASEETPRLIDPNATVADLLEMLNEHPENRGRLVAEISDVELSNIFNSQFFWHLWYSITFQNRSYKTNERLVDIVAERAKYSLALTVPALALGWLTAMIISSLVAFYRGGLIDKLGVFVSVLGMCVPYLIYMIAGQAIVFEYAPQRAWGLSSPANIYVPIGIAVIAGLGNQVRFYRTVILDEVNRDYVRTARAKGVPLPGIMFRHVLKNCMLPILTSLVVSIPFLILGSLLLERFFGIPGLGSLMVNSVSDRDVPLIAGLTFLTSVIYVVSLLITDILYAVFDPRVRLR